MSEILVEVRRGGEVESLHRGHAALVDVEGNLKAWAGNPETVTFMRSAAKPIQALAIVETGAYQAFGFSERDLAVMCASHGSEPFHVDAVLGILKKIGLTEDHLRCGTHWPAHKPSAYDLARLGRAPSPVHCNCSGKHAGMLTVCRHAGWPVDDYWRPDHPVQRLCLANLAETAAYPAEKIGIAADGCGVPVMSMPIRNMAQAFARLASPDDSATGFSPARARAARLIGRAMRAFPEMVGGTGRLCTSLMRHAPVLAKSGAEGVYCLGLPERGLGLAAKIEDGASRALIPVVASVLRGLGVLDAAAEEALRAITLPLELNHRGEKTGELRAVFTLKKGGGDHG